MKLYTDRKQWEELGKKGKKELEKWMIKTYKPDRLIPNTPWRMSIGEMIEFLDEKALFGEAHWPTLDKRIGGWRIREIVSLGIQKGFRKRTISQEKELCDTLWKAVKEILNENKGGG